MVKHIFDCFFSFSEPPEIRTVEGFSAVFAFVRCEHRLCSQSRRSTNCATPEKIVALPLKAAALTTANIISKTNAAVKG